MFQMILTQREIMDKEVYNVPNVLGMDIECYPFKGSIMDNREREVPMNGVGLTLYNAEASIDEDGCLFIGLSRGQAISLAEVLSKIVFNSNINPDESK